MDFEWSTSAKLISSVTEGNIEGAKGKIDGVSGKKDLSNFCWFVRFSEQIALYLLVKQKENLSQHQTSLGALGHVNEKNSQNFY